MKDKALKPFDLSNWKNDPKQDRISELEMENMSLRHEIEWLEKRIEYIKFYVNLDRDDK